MKKKCLLPVLLATFLVSIVPLASATHPPGTPVHILYSVTVTSGEWLTFTSGWVAKTEEQSIQFLQNTLLEVIIDGEAVENAEQYYLTPTWSPDFWIDLDEDGIQQDYEVGWWITFWLLDKHPLSVGTHWWSWTSIFLEDVYDGISVYPADTVITLEVEFYVEAGNVHSL